MTSKSTSSASFTEKWENASCELVDMDESYPQIVRDQCRWVRKVYVPAEHRGKGQATFLMHKIIGKAQDAGLTLLLTPGAFDEDGPEDDQLERWYRKLGFVTLQREPMILALYPNIKVTAKEPPKAR